MRTRESLTSAPIDLELARTVAVQAAEGAGRLVRAGDGSTPRTRAKGNTGDVVTDLDVGAEQLIIDQLRAAFPDHPIIAEESGLLAATDDDWAWLVDPLDGTNNLAIGLSDYVVGIALCRRGTPVLGVVHDPVHGQTWSAIRDAGAKGPRGRLRLPEYRAPRHGPVLAWSQGYAVGRTNPVARGLRLTMESRARRVLQLWAPLLAWVLLARGDIDGFVAYQAELVDLPAGWLLAQEAGIAVYGFDGEPFDARIDSNRDRSFVAGHPDAIPGLLGMVTAAGHVTVAGLPA